MIPHFSIVQVHFVFLVGLIVFFPCFIKYYHIMFIIVFLLECGRSTGLLYFVPDLLLPILTPLSLHSSIVYLISFLLFPCASVWENTRA